MTAQLRIPRLETCDTCKGSGAAAGSQPESCTTCQGSGQVRYQQGFFSVARTCHVCRGAGRVIKNPCADCKGSGRVEREKQMEVKVPAGVDEAAVRRTLLTTFNLEVGAGLGPLAGKIWRVGLMGASSTPQTLLQFLAALESALATHGHDVPAGAGAAAAAAALRPELTPA